MKSLWVFILFVLAVGAAVAQTPQETHFDFRVAALPQQVQMAGGGRTLLMGTSIEEPYWWNTVARCGALVNVGSGGATTPMLAARLIRILDIARPSVAVVAIGRNDAHDDFDFEVWKAHYNGIVLNLHRRQVTMVLETILPVEEGGPLGSAYFNEAAARRMSAHIRVLAGIYGAALNDMERQFDNANGFLPPYSTADGVHPRGPLYVSMHAYRTLGVSAAWRKRGISC